MKMKLKALIYAFPLVVASLLCADFELPPQLDVAVSSGYVWKSDSIYKSIYGKGIHNVATLDVAYFPLPKVGAGVQVGYWQSNATTCGCENLVKQDEEGYIIRTHKKWSRDLRMRQMPVLAYLKARVGDKMQAYASVGGGAVIVTEKSNDEHSSRVAPALAVEVGGKAYFAKDAYVMASIQWVNAHKRLNGYAKRLDFGGKSVKFGLGGSF